MFYQFEDEITTIELEAINPHYITVFLVLRLIIAKVMQASAHLLKFMMITALPC